MTDFAELVAVLRRLIAASKSTIGDYRAHKDAVALLARLDGTPNREGN